MSDFTKGIKALWFLLFPFFVAVVIWGFFMNPETYWQKVASLIGGFITVIITFYIEISLSN